MELLFLAIVLMVCATIPFFTYLGLIIGILLILSNIGDDSGCGCFLFMFIAFLLAIIF